MITFHYQVLRYQPDKMGEEFINLGVVVFDTDTFKHLFKYQESNKRLSAFFPAGNNVYIKGLVRSLAETFSPDDNEPAQKPRAGAQKGLRELTASLLPSVDSALYFTEVRSGLDTDLETAIHSLYERIVTRYEHATEQRITA